MVQINNIKRIEVLIKLLILLTISLASVSQAQSSCEPYSGSLCSIVVDSYQHNNNRNIYKFLSTLPQSLVEETLNSKGLSNLTLIGPAFLPSCYLATAKYFCGSYFSSCNDTAGTPVKVPICRSVCENFLTECEVFFKSSGNEDLLKQDCSTLPVAGTETCETMEKAAIDYDSVICQEPLLKNPNPSIITNTCPGGCCIPCPVLDVFYPKGLIGTFYYVWLVSSVISFFGNLFVFISYLCLPDKRRFPQVIVLCLSASATLVFAMSLMTAGYGRDNLFCVDSVTPSAGENAHAACVAQAAIITYGLIACSLWFAFLVINVHLNVVWKKQTLEDYPAIYQTVIWILPLASVIALGYSKEITHTTGVWCHPRQGVWIEATLLIPLGFFIFPSFLFNLWTLWRIYQISKETHESLKRILFIQLRPFLFAFAAIAVVIPYWIFAQSIQGESLTSKPKWLFDWIMCVQAGNGQNRCSKLAHVPSPGGMFITEIILHNLGLVIFCFFGLRVAILKEWLHFLFPKYFSEFSSSFVSQEKSMVESKSNLNPEKTMMELKPQTQDS